MYICIHENSDVEIFKYISVDIYRQNDLYVYLHIYMLYIYICIYIYIYIHITVEPLFSDLCGGWDWASASTRVF